MKKSFPTSRSTGIISGEQHGVQLMASTKEKGEIKAGHIIVCPHAMLETDGVKLCQIKGVRSLDLNDQDQDFQKVVNPESSESERRQTRDLVQANRQAVAYGDRNLGFIDGIKMTSDIRDASPVSSLPYHASPHGRKAIEETIAALLADEAIGTFTRRRLLLLFWPTERKDCFCTDYHKVNMILKADGMSMVVVNQLTKTPVLLSPLRL